MQPRDCDVSIVAVQNQKGANYANLQDEYRRNLATIRCNMEDKKHVSKHVATSYISC